MKSLRELDISLDVLLSKLEDLILVMNPAGTILYANRQFLDHLHYDEPTILRCNFITDIVEESYRPVIQDTIAQPQSQPDDFSLVLATQLGEEIAVESHFIPHETAAGQVIICVLHQVPERNQSHIELERMFTMSLDMLGVVNYEGCFVRLNPAWEQVLGYSLDEMLGKRFMQFVHPDDRERTAVEAQRGMDNFEVYHFKNRYICKNGDVKWISWQYISYPDLQQTYFVARDITDEQHHQTLLQETQHQLQGILDNSGTMIGLKNLDGRYILVNQEFADIFAGGDKSKLLGKQDTDIFDAQIASKLAENDALVFKYKRSQQFEEKITGPGGTRTYLTTRFLLNDDTDDIYGICMIAKDITYRKLTEMQLLMRNQAMEYSPSCISIADARLPDLPLIYINPAFEATTGYSALDVIGRNCRFLQGDDRQQDEVRIIREAIQNEEPVEVILRNYRKDGTMFYNELRLAPIHNNDGELTHYVGITTDVTERIHAQEQIQKQNQALIAANHDLAKARRQAEDATTLKSQFLATMSHELRTPLNAIIGYTEIQLAGMTGEITDEQRDYQERVVTNAEHLLNLINDVLDISKIEAGRLELVNKTFNLRDWVADVDNQMRVLAEEKNLDFVVTVDKRMPEEIEGDPARIKQVVINLLSNAIKFTESGSITMRVRKHGRDAWNIFVEDTGIGIQSHMQETIFEEFRQVDSSSRRKVGGTGLGLAIVRKLLLMMGGTVRLTSQAGEGSTFTITLPFYGKELPLSASSTGGHTHD